MNPLLAKWLEDVMNDELIISIENPEVEFENTWSFTIPTNEGVTTDSLLSFIENIINCRSKQASIQMTIYFWCDEMSGQLKFSLTSLPKEKLPFKCEIEHIDDINEIIALCLNISEPGVNSYAELEGLTIEEAFQTEIETSLRLKVWSKVINERTCS